MAGRSYSLIHRPNVKPAPGTPLNRHHPAVPSLKFIWPFWEGIPNAVGKGPVPRELLTGLISTPGSVGIQWVADRHGLGAYVASSNYLNLGVDSTILPTATEFTAILVRRKVDGTLRTSGVFGDSNDSSAAFRCTAQWPALDGNGYFDYGGVTDNTSRLTISALPFDVNTLDVNVFRVSTKYGMAAFRNGAKLGQTTGAPVARSNAGGSFQARLGWGAANGPDNQVVYLYGIWWTGLKDDLCAMLSIAPWALFEDIQKFQIVTLPAPGGDGLAAGSSTVSGVGRLIIGGLASSAGAASISGSGENAGAFHEADGSAAGAAVVTGLSNPITVGTGGSAGASVVTALGENIGTEVALLPLEWEEVHAFDQEFLLQWDELQLAPLTGGELTLEWLEIESLDPLPLTWTEVPAGVEAAVELDPQRPYLKIEG